MSDAGLHVVSYRQTPLPPNAPCCPLAFLPLLQEFLTLGYSVLLSDVDIVTLQNPFDHLYRCSNWGFAVAGTS